MCSEPLEGALADIRSGRPLIVVDDEDRENEGDLVLAAERVTPELVGFLVRHGSGVVCIAMLEQRLQELNIPLMVPGNTGMNFTAFTVSVDAQDGVTTGISAADRATTLQALADPMTRPEDLARPGHIFPLQYTPGGVLRRAGHTEAAVDLARLANLYPAGVLCEVVNPDGSMARLPELQRFGKEHGLRMISIADLIRYRLRSERLVRGVGEARIPNEQGDWMARAYESFDGREHIALVRGDVATEEPVLVRVHSECFTGDVLGSLRCDCQWQFASAMEKIQEAGRGVIVYIRGHEGRGIGLRHKLQAYALQDEGFDTVEANLKLGFDPDPRDYGVGAQILAHLGISAMRLLTNNPTKRAGIEGYGLQIVDCVPLETTPNRHNLRYLQAKKDRLGHLLPRLPAGVVDNYPGIQDGLRRRPLTP